MSAIILDGKKISEEIKKELRADILKLKKGNVIPGLAMVLVGDNPASKVYVRYKEKISRELEILSRIFQFPENIKEDDLLELIEGLNKDEKIHGILVQLPLPKSLDEQKIISTINLNKDVDCFHPDNIGKMFLNYPTFFPCTPGGILEMFKRQAIEVLRKNIVIVGSSNIVGKPLAVMLLNAGATVTVCHSETRNLKELTKEADILISAVGKPGLITADMVKQGAVVVDVGISRGNDGKLYGDVDFSEVSKKAGAITPVPGGVGPMTVAMLIKNTIQAAKNIHNL
jgi:methylenetetrahydrofolate dehydrogenase (NADP+) / methenyltetrahydrofolate cyclohydrolase